MSTTTQQNPAGWQTSASCGKAMEILIRDFLMVNEKLTKKTKLDVVMETTPDPKEGEEKLVISNPNQNILTPIKNWPRVTGLLTATGNELMFSVCPLGKEDKIGLLTDRIGFSWYPPVVLKISNNEFKIFSLCQNGKIWYRENELGKIERNPIAQEIIRQIISTLKNAGI